MVLKLKALGLTLGLLFIMFLGLWWIGETVGGLTASTRKNTLTLEGRRLLYQMQQRLINEGEAGECPMITVRYGAGYFKGQKNESVWWGIPEYEAAAREICPDCAVTPEKFKIITVGNIDQDPDLDVWIQSSDQIHPVHFRKD